MLGPRPVVAASRITLRLGLLGALVELERWKERWWARVRARRREERWRARSSAEGGSPNMKNFMKKKIMRAMESWPRRKPWVNERPLEVLVGVRFWEVHASLRGAVGYGLWRGEVLLNHCGGLDGHLCGIIMSS